MAGNTNQGIKRIWAIAKSPELGLTDEELHLFVQTLTGKDSIRALNQREAQKVIGALGHMKDSAKKAEGRKKRSSKSSTENQRKKIYMLAKQLGWNRQARVNGMCRRMFRVSSVEWLNYRQCSDLIEALKKMVERKEETADGREEDDRPGEEAPGAGEETAAGGGDPSAGQAQAEPEEVY